MAGTKRISALPSLSSPSVDDIVPVTDLANPATTKKATIASILALGGGGGGGQTADVQAALDGANAPDAGNVFATMADVGGGGGGVATWQGPFDFDHTTYTGAITSIAVEGFDLPVGSFVLRIAVVITTAFDNITGGTNAPLVVFIGDAGDGAQSDQFLNNPPSYLTHTGRAQQWLLSAPDLGAGVESAVVSMAAEMLMPDLGVYIYGAFTDPPTVGAGRLMLEVMTPA